MTVQARVLVVDDEEGFCETIETFLGGHGHTVELAYTGEDGLQKLKSFRPHVILLDIRMPGIGGLEALTQMKAHDPSIKVIVVTAIHDQEVGKKALEKGADDYLTKPVDLDYLNTLVMLRYIKAIG